MPDFHDTLARLYLPLLCNSQSEVRRQAYALLVSTYGPQALPALRELLNDPDARTRTQVRQSLHAIAALDADAAPPRERHMQISCLGGLRVALGERVIQPHDWMQRDAGRAGWRKVQGVFAYLADRGWRGASRAELGAAVWGGDVSSTSLSRTLTALRQMLLDASDAQFVARALVVTREQVLLLPECYHSDVQVFEHIFQLACVTESEHDLAAAVPLYSRAVQLYAGPYLADVALDWEWLERRRDHYTTSFLIAAERLAEHAFGERRYHQCIAICRRALDADETAEEIHVWLLRAYARLHQYSDLTHTYRRYVQVSTLARQDGDAEHDQVVRTYHELTARC